jgi:hypothetical protein
MFIIVKLEKFITTIERRTTTQTMSWKTAAKEVRRTRDEMVTTEAPTITQSAHGEAEENRTEVVMSAPVVTNGMRKTIEMMLASKSGLGKSGKGGKS